MLSTGPPAEEEQGTVGSLAFCDSFSLAANILFDAVLPWLPGGRSV